MSNDSYKLNVLLIVKKITTSRDLIGRQRFVIVADCVNKLMQNNTNN